MTRSTENHDLQIPINFKESYRLIKMFLQSVFVTRVSCKAKYEILSRDCRIFNETTFFPTFEIFLSQEVVICSFAYFL